jgi:hypothetical protein
MMTHCKLDVWHRTRAETDVADVLLSPQAFETYEKLFDLFQIPFEIVESNIQRYFFVKQRLN